jgi:choline dehydrogenase-like flavoprotein
MSSRDDELTTEPSGRLRGTRRVYVVDGSVFPALPSKGLTFTMMANANRIACGIREELRR